MRPRTRPSGKLYHFSFSSLRFPSSSPSPPPPLFPLPPLLLLPLFPLSFSLLLLLLTSQDGSSSTIMVPDSELVVRPPKVAQGNVAGLIDRHCSLPSDMWQHPTTALLKEAVTYKAKVGYYNSGVGKRGKEEERERREGEGKKNRRGRGKGGGRRGRNEVFFFFFSLCSTWAVSL